MATRTFTLDVAGLKYIDKDGISHTITTNDDFQLTFSDTGDGGVYTGLAAGNNYIISCTDGFKFIIEADNTFSKFTSSTDGAASVDNGDITFVEEGNVRNIWKVKSLTMVDADGTGANNVTTLILEQRACPSRVITWTNINMA